VRSGQICEKLSRPNVIKAYLSSSHSHAANVLSHDLEKAIKAMLEGEQQGWRRHKRGLATFMVCTATWAPEFTYGWVIAHIQLEPVLDWRCTWAPV
jgi:hypothetical protein